VYLPGASRWVVAFEPVRHARLVRHLLPKLGRVEPVRLGIDAPGRVQRLAERHARDEAYGFVEFVVWDGERTHAGIDYHDALMSFAAWPVNRLRLFLDVTDANVRSLFAENPDRVRARCRRLCRRLDPSETIAVATSRTSGLKVQCSRVRWKCYTGLEPDDYMLPSGEVACAPGRTDGTIDVDGWVVGTLPFGMKYGRIRRGGLRLEVRNGSIERIDGNARRLCADFDAVMDVVPGLRRVAELGFGQSRAVARAAKYHEVGCLWHERYFGVHIGFGETLEATGVRDVGHHLDVVLAHGHAFDDEGRTLLRW
jgi:leucyl aminopeptidase (aminopeptidase T)